VNSLLNKFLTVLPVSGKNISLSGQNPPAPPTGQGIIDKQTLINSGNFVTTDLTYDPTPVINTVTSGTWRITLYEDNGVNETNNYSNYIFTFNSNGVLTAANSPSYNGTWSVTVSNSNVGSQDGLDFNIAFVAPAPSAFTDLTNDWGIISYTSTKIQLFDVSGGNGGTAYLTFEKN
jgi:hypothetical protein